MRQARPALLAMSGDVVGRCASLARQSYRQAPPSASARRRTRLIEKCACREFFRSPRSRAGRARTSRGSRSAQPPPRTRSRLGGALREDVLGRIATVTRLSGRSHRAATRSSWPTLTRPARSGSRAGSSCCRRSRRRRRSAARDDLQQCADLLDHAVVHDHDRSAMVSASSWSW